MFTSLELATLCTDTQLELKQLLPSLEHPEALTVKQLKAALKRLVTFPSVQQIDLRTVDTRISKKSKAELVDAITAILCKFRAVQPHHDVPGSFSAAAAQDVQQQRTSDLVQMKRNPFEVPLETCYTCQLPPCSASVFTLQAGFSLQEAHIHGLRQGTKFLTIRFVNTTTSLIQEIPANWHLSYKLTYSGGQAIWANGVCSTAPRNVSSRKGVFYHTGVCLSTESCIAGHHSLHVAVQNRVNTNNLCIIVELIELKTVDQLLHDIITEHDIHTKHLSSTEDAPVLLQRTARVEEGEVEDEAIVHEPSSKISLHCPWSACRPKIPFRGKRCTHLGCFDLETFLHICSTSKLFECPFDSQPLPLEDLEYAHDMHQVLQILQLNEEADFIDVNSDGSWRVHSAVEVIQPTKPILLHRSDPPVKLLCHGPQPAELPYTVFDSGDSLSDAICID